MRSWIVGFVGVLIIVVLGACSFDEVKDKFVSQALGVLVYGDAESVDVAISDFSSDIVDSSVWHVKVTPVAGHGDVMIIDEDVAGEMVAKGLWNKILDGDKVSPVSNIPVRDDGVWMTKSADDSIRIDGSTFDAVGNYILGNGRTYVKSFVVVPRDMWDSFVGEEHVVGFLYFHEDENPKRKLIDFSDDVTIQLVDLK